MKLAIGVAILAFAALIFLATLIFIALEALTRVEELKKRFERFAKFSEKRSTLVHLLLVSIFLMAGNATELVMKEVPDVPEPPIIKMPPPQIIVENPEVITHMLPEPPKCWSDSTYGYGTPLVSEKSRMQRIVVFHCNYRIEAPFEVVAEFDGDFDEPQNRAAMWGLTLPGAGVVNLGGREKRGRLFRERIDGPSLPANEHVILTIYAAAGKEAAPQLVRAGIHSVQ